MDLVIRKNMKYISGKIRRTKSLLGFSPFPETVIRMKASNPLRYRR
jgi:hypothetical protein